MQFAQVIILSTVRSNREKDIGFLTEKRRLNVAVSKIYSKKFDRGNHLIMIYTNQVTRAKRLLVMVADRQTLQNSKTYKGFFNHVQKSGEIKCASEI